MKNSLFILALATFLLQSCGSSYLKTSTNVSKTKKAYDKILIVSRAKDKTVRIAFENKVVEDFKAQGVSAEPSYKIMLSDFLSEGITEGQVASLKEDLIKKGFNGVVVTNLINTEEYKDVIPGTPTTAYYPVRYGRFGRYYSYYPVTYWGPDYVQSGTLYTLESCLYDISERQNDNLQWVGRFQVKDPKDIVQAIGNYSKELTEALMKESIASE